MGENHIVLTPLPNGCPFWLRTLRTSRAWNRPAETLIVRTPMTRVEPVTP